MRAAKITSVVSLLVLSVVACRPREQVKVDVEGIDGGTNVSTTPTTSPINVGVDGGACETDAHCPKGQLCLFTESGCQTTGHCRSSSPVRNCYAAIAMCSCRDHRTFYGAGGCAGAAGERWELYACPCSSDADCRGGQRCRPVSAKPHRPDAAKECRDPNEP